MEMPVLKRKRPNSSERRKGNVLSIAVISLAVLSVIVFASLDVARERVIEQRTSDLGFTAELAAQSAVELQIARFNEAMRLASTSNPWELIDRTDTNPHTGPGGYTHLAQGVELRDFSGDVYAEYDLFVDVETTGPTRRHVTIVGHAYVPTKQAFADGARNSARHDASTVIEISFRGGEVFDYAYFINHWGWFFGDSITANGSVRSNGIFGFGGYKPTVNGSPRYQGANGHKLLGYLDDNQDGVTDGSDGGVYSGLEVDGEQNVRGMGGLSKNQHIVGPAVMPNLSNMSVYEGMAIDKSGSISIGSQTLVSGVLGDDAGEKQHLYLNGTSTNPIVLDGPVVVRGSVIIGGKVTGQGSIYAGGNVYIAKNLEYVNGPSTVRPASNDQATVEAWRQNALDRDSLGLFAREHIVIGDYTHSWWQHYVGQWVNDPNNESKEDAGIDGVQNTRKGPDGILGTADDDVLEGDGVWTVSRYTAEDAANGLIPDGYSVGDVIPGSGEDIDGDGAYDGRTQMSEFELPASLNPQNWAGLNTSYSNFKDIATVEISRIDGALYTNHTLGALLVHSGGTVQFNGSIVSRNEAIVYSANGVQMNHDERLTGRGSAESGFETPVTWDPVRVVHQEQGSILPSGTSHDPSLIASHYTSGN